MLTSPKNPKVTAASRLKKRAFRDEDRRFLVEGAQAVSEALGVPGALETLFTDDELAPLAVQARQAGVEVHQVGDEVIRALTSTVTPQALVGVSPYLDRGLDALPDDGCVPDPARGARPRERRHRAPFGRRGGCRRRGVHRQLGRRLQPQDRALVGRARCSICRSFGAPRRPRRSPP